VTPHVRPARKADIPRIRAIARQVCKQVKAHRRGQLRAPLEFASTQRDYERALKDRQRCLLVATQGSRVIGYALAGIETEPDDLTDVPRVDVAELAVDARSRGRGTGRALLKAVHDWARSRDIGLVQLAVWEFNKPALHLYARAGYRTLMRKLELSLVPTHRVRSRSRGL
jgi:ribosomal protein S18 acetylase RimI-like enzyme